MERVTLREHVTKSTFRSRNWGLGIRFSRMRPESGGSTMYSNISSAAGTDDSGASSLQGCASKIDRAYSLVPEPAATLGEICERCQHRILHLPHHVTRNLHAEDVVQECYMRAFMRLDGFSGKSKTSTWFSRITINAVLMKICTRRRKLFSIDDLANSSWSDCPPEIVSDRPAPDRQRWERELARILTDSLGPLNPDLFSAAELHYFNELSAREYVRVIGSSLSNVKVRIFRAKLTFRCLDKHLRQRALPACCNSSVDAHHRVPAARASSYREGKQHRICLPIAEDAREPGTGTGTRSISFTAR